MGRGPAANEREPAVVLIAQRYDLTMDEWLASLRHDEPIDLGVTGAELVAEGRAARS